MSRHSFSTVYRDYEPQLAKIRTLIKLTRLRLGMSERQLAIKAGVNRTTMRRAMQPDGYMEMPVFLALCDALALPPYHVMRVVRGGYEKADEIWL